MKGLITWSQILMTQNVVWFSQDVLTLRKEENVKSVKVAWEDNSGKTKKLQAKSNQTAWMLNIQFEYLNKTI